MDWESYRTDLEAIKLAVNECERLGVDKEELLIISIYRLYEFYKTEDDRVYLLGALLHLKAYLELGMEYEKNRKIFSLILDNYGVCYQDIFLLDDLHEDRGLGQRGFVNSEYISMS